MADNIPSITRDEKKDNLTEIETLWKVKDVARYLCLTPETVRSMARKGEIPSVKVGKRVWRFNVHEIKKLVQQNDAG